VTCNLATTRIQLDLGLASSELEGRRELWGQVGKNGVTDAFIEALGNALEANELVKVRVVLAHPLCPFQCARVSQTLTHAPSGETSPRGRGAPADGVPTSLCSHTGQGGWGLPGGGGRRR
jgi:hypothetical protein